MMRWRIKTATHAVAVLDTKINRPNVTVEAMQYRFDNIHIYTVTCGRLAHTSYKTFSEMQMVEYLELACSYGASSAVFIMMSR